MLLTVCFYLLLGYWSCTSRVRLETFPAVEINLEGHSSAFMWWSRAKGWITLLSAALIQVVAEAWPFSSQDLTEQIKPLITSTHAQAQQLPCRLDHVTANQCLACQRSGRPDCWIQLSDSSMFTTHKASPVCWTFVVLAWPSYLDVVSEWKQIHHLCLLKVRHTHCASRNSRSTAHRQQFLSVPLKKKSIIYSRTEVQAVKIVLKDHKTWKHTHC